MSTATLFVTFKQPGFHNWPNATPYSGYLSQRHRHLFHVRVEVAAAVDGNRSVEFHDLLDRAQIVMRDIAERASRGPAAPGTYEYGDMSCEQIADAMAKRLGHIYETVTGVTVSEDGECGAIVYYDPD